MNRELSLSWLENCLEEACESLHGTMDCRISTEALRIRCHPGVTGGEGHNMTAQGLTMWTYDFIGSFTSCSTVDK